MFALCHRGESDLKSLGGNPMRVRIPPRAFTATPDCRRTEHASRLGRAGVAPAPLPVATCRDRSAVREIPEQKINERFDQSFDQVLSPGGAPGHITPVDQFDTEDGGLQR